MDDEAVRFLLGACRPSGADALHPEIAAALAQAARDPELAAWLERERRADEAIARLLLRHEPPAELRARLLAGARVSRRPRRWRPLAPLARAAGIALAAAVGWWGVRLHEANGLRTETGTLRDWQQSAVGIFADPAFHLDREAPEYPPLAAHLRARGAPVVDAVPFGPRVRSAVGCKVLDWSDATVSLSCFRADTGELVHLFVIPRGHFDERSLQDGPFRAQVGDYATITWRQRDRVVMIASRLAAPELELMIVPGARFAISAGVAARTSG